MIRLTIAGVVIAVFAVVLVWWPMSRTTAGLYLLGVGFILGLLVPRNVFTRRKSP